MKMGKSRYIGEYPVIGIRPVIDARQGMLDVRGSLESQTMSMAKAAKRLLEQNMKYSNGETVKVIIAGHTIGRVAEAAACAAEFKKEGVGITLSVTPCWRCLSCMCSCGPRPERAAGLWDLWRPCPGEG